MPIFEVHGTADTIVAYNGGLFASVPETIARWVAIDGCGAGSTISFSAGAASCETYGGCMGGAEVTLCTVRGQGHGWPGSPLVTDNQDLPATDAIWDFFVRYPMP